MGTPLVWTGFTNVFAGDAHSRPGRLPSQTHEVRFDEPLVWSVAWIKLALVLDLGRVKVKMSIVESNRVPVRVSPGVIAGILGVAAASQAAKRRDPPRAEGARRPTVGEVA